MDQLPSETFAYVAWVTKTRLSGAELHQLLLAQVAKTDPETAARDLSIPHTLMRRFDHADCGVYAEVIAGGTIATGDDVTVSPSA